MQPAETYRFDRLSVTTETKEGKYKLTWGVRNGYPRATLFKFTNDGKKMEYYLPSNMDIVSLSSLLDDAIDCVKTGKKFELGLKCNSRKLTDSGRRDGDIFEMSTLLVGITKEGIAYLRIKGGDEITPNIPLEFNNWHTLTTASGENDRGTLSRLYARAYLKNVLALLSKYSHSYIGKDAYVDPKDTKVGTGARPVTDKATPATEDKAIESLFE